MHRLGRFLRELWRSRSQPARPEIRTDPSPEARQRAEWAALLADVRAAEAARRRAGEDEDDEQQAVRR